SSVSRPGFARRVGRPCANTVQRSDTRGMRAMMKAAHTRLRHRPSVALRLFSMTRVVTYMPMTYMIAERMSHPVKEKPSPPTSMTSPALTASDAAATTIQVHPGFCPAVSEFLGFAVLPFGFAGGGAEGV